MALGRIQARTDAAAAKKSGDGQRYERARTAPSVSSEARSVQNVTRDRARGKPRVHSCGKPWPFQA